MRTTTLQQLPLGAFKVCAAEKRTWRNIVDFKNAKIIHVSNMDPYQTIGGWFGFILVALQLDIGISPTPTGAIGCLWDPL